MNDWMDADPPKRTRPGVGMRPENRACRQDDAITTPLDVREYE